MVISRKTTVIIRAIASPLGAGTTNRTSAEQSQLRRELIELLGKTTPDTDQHWPSVLRSIAYQLAAAQTSVCPWPRTTIRCSPCAPTPMSDTHLFPSRICVSHP